MIDGHQDECRHCWHWRSRSEQLDRIEHKLDLQLKQGERIMGALQNLQAADVALKDEVTTFLQNISGRLGGSSDADVQAVADDINAEVAALQGGDPGPVATDPAAPTDGGDAPVDGSPAAE